MHNLKIIDVFLCNFAIGIWLIFYYHTDMGIRGFEIDNQKNYLELLGSLCNDLPMCLRIGMGILYNILAFIYEHIFIIFGSKTIYYNRIAGVTGFVICYTLLLISFINLIKDRNNAIKIFVLGSFIFTPILIGKNSGLMVYDYLVLFFWGYVVNKNCCSNTKKIIITICATLIMENTGVAFIMSISYYWIATGQYKNRSNIYWTGALLIFSILIIYIIYYILNYINNEVHWIAPGKNIMYANELYGSQNHVGALLKSYLQMNLIPIMVILTCFTIFYIKFNHFMKIDDEIKWSISTILGFSTTIIPGYFVSGLSSEWTRQFLQRQYLFCFLMAQILSKLYKMRRIKLYHDSIIA